LKKGFKIVRTKEGRWKFYKVLDSKGKEIAEFDDYNFQKPFHQAREYVKKLEK